MTRFAHRLARRDWAALLLTALLGLAVTAAGYLSMRDAEALRQQQRSQAAAREIFGYLERDLARTVEAVRNAGLMVQTHAQLPRSSFLQYGEQLTRALPPITLLEWQPVVAGADREAFERAAQAQGLTAYRIVEPDSAGGLWLAAPAREAYVPILFAWPETHAPLGFNLGPDAMRMASKLEAAALGRPVASGSFPILKRDIQGPGIKGFAITTAVGPPPGRAASAAQGYLAAVIELPALLQDVARRAHAAQMELWVFEGADATGPLLFAGREARAPAQAGAALALQRMQTLSVAERPWTLLLQPDAAFLQAPRAEAKGLLALGVLATLLLTGMLWRAQQQRAAAQAARAETERQRERLANVIDGTQAATWEFDLLHHEHHVNAHWDRLRGHEPGEHAPGPDFRWDEDCHPDDKARVTQALHAHLRGETDHFDVEYRQRHRSRGWIWVHSRGRVLQRTPAGRAQVFAGTVLDVNDRKVAEARILELNSSLEARVAERGAQLERALESLRASREELAQADARATLHTLMASAAHELQTPLGNGLICSQTLVDLTREFEARLARGELRRSELQQFIARVGENATLTHRNLLRSADLVKRFRQVAADQGSEERRPFDLAVMVRDLLDTLAPTLSRLPHRLDCDIAPGIAMDSYPGPLGQVLINLINNATLHAFAPGQVGRMRIAAERQGDGVKLSFSDDGSGMDAATLKRLFEPYFSTRIGQGGTGLGMSIVDTMVRKALGGSLKVDSSPGAGTRVEIRLPLRAP